MPVQTDITILITAHNEADRIQPCLRAIMAQDYPMERVEILLVDDRSTDGTAERARALRLDCLRVLRLDEVPEKLTARQAALDLGFREAKGELVLVTDAGGRVPREWIRELSGHMGYRDGAATAPIVFAGGNYLFARYQTIDTMFNLSLHRWASRHGRPTGIFSANMCVRREAYLETGGFPVIGFALAEDLALGEALCRAGWSIRYLSGPATQNPACKSLRELLSRARRRAHNMPVAIKNVSLALIITNTLLVLIAAIWGGMTSFWGFFWLFLLLARYGIGMLLIAISSSQYGQLGIVHWVWIYEPVMTLLGLWAHLSNTIKPHWQWGGAHYDKPQPQAQPQPDPPKDTPTA